MQPQDASQIVQNAKRGFWCEATSSVVEGLAHNSVQEGGDEMDPDLDGDGNGGPTVFTSAGKGVVSIAVKGVAIAAKRIGFTDPIDLFLAVKQLTKTHSEALQAGRRDGAGPRSIIGQTYRGA